MADAPISVTFNGKAFTDAENSQDFMDDLVRAIERAASNAIEEESRGLTKRIVRAFESQSLPLKKLSRDYLAKKESRGFDPRIGFYTGEMVKAIKFFKDNPKKFFIGIRRQKPAGRKRTGSSGVVIPQYAHNFEFGTRKQPARPVFMPLLASSKSKYYRTIRRNIKEAISDVARIWGVK